MERNAYPTITYFAVKGGQGCSTTAVASALELLKRPFARVNLVDPSGDCLSLLGLSPAADRGPVEAGMLTVSRTPLPMTRAYTIVDAGVPRTEADIDLIDRTDPRDHVVLVTRADALSVGRYLDRWAGHGVKPDGFVTLMEPAHGLSAPALSEALNLGTLAVIDADWRVPHATNGGKFADMPDTLTGPIEDLMDRLQPFVLVA